MTKTDDDDDDDDEYLSAEWIPWSNSTPEWGPKLYLRSLFDNDEIMIIIVTIIIMLLDAWGRWLANEGKWQPPAWAILTPRNFFNSSSSLSSSWSTLRYHQCLHNTILIIIAIIMIIVIVTVPINNHHPCLQNQHHHHSEECCVLKVDWLYIYKKLKKIQI